MKRLKVTKKKKSRLHLYHSRTRKPFLKLNRQGKAKDDVITMTLLEKKKIPYVKIKILKVKT